MGNVVKRAWEVLLSRVAFFFAVSVLINLPGMILQLVYDPSARMGKLLDVRSGTFHAEQVWPVFTEYLRVAGPATLLMMVVSIIGFGVMTLVAFQHMSGQPRALDENLTQAVKRFFPLFGLSILGALGVGVGLILLIIPGIMLMVRWGICSQVCVIEKTGPIASLKRSAELTDGNRWRLFGFAILLILAFYVIMLPFTLLFMAIIWFGAGSISLTGVKIVSALWGLLINGVFLGVGYCLSVAVYQELRRVKEGLASPATIAVFD